MSRACAGRCSIGCSSNRTWPPLAASRPAITFRVVVFPEPEGPSRVRNSPRRDVERDAVEDLVSAEDHPDVLEGQPHAHVSGFLCGRLRARGGGAEQQRREPEHHDRSERDQRGDGRQGRLDRLGRGPVELLRERGLLDRGEEDRQHRLVERRDERQQPAAEDRGLDQRQLDLPDDRGPACPERGGGAPEPRVHPAQRAGDDHVDERERDHGVRDDQRRRRVEHADREPVEDVVDPERVGDVRDRQRQDERAAHEALAAVGRRAVASRAPPRCP